MKKNTRNIVAATLLLVGGYFIYRYFKQNKPSRSGSGVSPQDLGNIPQAPILVDTFPLKKGSKGDKVVELQTVIFRINPNLLPKFGIDGDFGSETEAAVRKLTNKNTINNQQEIENLKKTKNTSPLASGFTPSFKLGL
jgi:hypothetical protein